MPETERQHRIRILHLEDDANDVELIQGALKADGLRAAVETVATRKDFAAALERGDFDLILSDYALPGFDGISALGMARETAPDVFASSQRAEQVS